MNINWEYLNARIVGDGVMWLSHVESKEQDTSSIVVCTNPNITNNLNGVARQMIKLIPPILKLRKVNHAHMHSNARIVKTITRWTPTNVHSGNIGSIVTGIAKNKSKSVKIKTSWFAQLWVTS